MKQYLPKSWKLLYQLFRRYCREHLFSKQNFALKHEQLWQTQFQISTQQDIKINQYFENKEQIVAELLLRKSENLGQALKQLVMLQQQTAIQDIITLSIAFGFESLKSDHGFFIEILKNWHAYSDSEAAQVLERHFLEIGMYLFGRYYPHWDFETLKHKSFVIINSTLFTMMRYASKNTFLIEEQRLQQELSKMIISFLDAV